MITFVPPWRHYFAQPDDLLSALTIPVVPSLVYAALLMVMGAALRRRLLIAWWLFVLWWLVVPEVTRVLNLLDDFRLADLIGFVLMSTVIVLAWRVRKQFAARGVSREPPRRGRLLHPRRRGHARRSGRC